MSRARTSGVYSAAKNTLRQNPRKLTVLHALPDPEYGAWMEVDLDIDINRGELKWLRSVGIIELYEHNDYNTGHSWRSTRHVPALKSQFDPPGCGTGGILDCGGDRFVTTSEGLECKFCGELTPKARARARMNGRGES